MIIPKADDIGIEHILEHGGDNYERGHWSFLCDTNVEVTKAFMRQFFGELGEPIFKGSDEKFFGKEVQFDEVYGANKIKENLRFWYAFHIKRMKRYHLTLHNGEDVGEVIDGKPDPVSVIKAINGLQIVTEDFMKSYIKDDMFPASVLVPEVKWKPEKIMYEDLNLPLATPVLPYKMQPAFKNCQALKGLLDKVYLDKGIEKAGKKYHDIGLCLAGTFRFYGLAYNAYDEAKACWEYIKNETRFRSDKDHFWWYGPDKDQPDIYFWSCKKLDEYFGACDGCPFRGMINSPKDFIRGKSMEKEVLPTDKYLVTLDKLRNEVFPEFRQRVKNCYVNEDRVNFALRNKMSSGKSHNIYDLIAELVKEYPNTKILLSVHEIKAAVAARDALVSRGIDTTFVLASHESTFGHQAGKEATLTDFDCLYFKEIQKQAKAGVLSTSYKSEFCKGCPLKDSCPYPSQYSNVMEPDYNVVIIQHAHLSCQEVVFKLMEKEFNLLVVDENFLSYTSQYIDINEKEIEVLDSLQMSWSDKIVSWLKEESKAKGKLDPSETQLEAALLRFKEAGLVYRVPDLIRLFNQHREANSLTGIEVVYELPHIPIKIFLDGTMPINLIKQMTGIDSLIVYGEDEVIDIQAIHPGNRRFQIMDVTNSKHKMSQETYFELLMGKICQIIKDYLWDKKTLITIYSWQRESVEDYINTNFPEIKPFIDIGLMNKGTNKWAHFDAQFVLAGRYRIGQDYMEEAYRIKTVVNHYRSKKGKKRLNNMYPLGVTNKTDISWDKVPFQALMKINGELKLVKFKDFLVRIPKVDRETTNETDPAFWYWEIYKQDIGEMEQHSRVRPNPTRPYLEWRFSNHYLPDLMQTDVLTFHQFLGSGDPFDY